MLNRRHLRIKILQSIYAFFQSHNLNIDAAEKELFKNIEQIQDIFLYFILSIDEIANIERHLIEKSKDRQFSSIKMGLDKREKFVNNQFFKLLSENEELRLISDKRKINWIGAEEQNLLTKVLKDIKESEVYGLYLVSDNSSFEEDKKFAIELFKEQIANSELIFNFLEEKNINSVDDIDLVCSMVIKNLKTFEIDGKNHILSLYKDEEEEKDFIRRLFRKSLASNEVNKKLINKLISNWELDRLALMDIILMNMAISEAEEFDNIPLKVTLNEYIDISKYYSTPKSNSFINGVLDKAFSLLEKEGKINKSGRGLLNK